MRIEIKVALFTKLLALILCMFCQPAFCQVYTGENYASLQKSLAESRSDAELINYQLQIADYLIKKPGKHKENIDLAGLWISRAEQLNEKLKSTEAKGHILLEKGLLLNVKDPTPEAFVVINKAIELLKNNPDKCLLANAYKALFVYYNAETPGEVDKKKEVIKQSLLYFKQCGNNLEEALTLQDQADMYLSTTNFPLALKTLNESQAMLATLHYQQLQRLYSLYGIYCFLQADYQNCLQYQYKALEICRQMKDSTALYCEVNNMIYMSLEYTEQPSQAIPYLKEALLISKRNGDTATSIGFSLNLSSALSKLNRLQDALSVLDDVKKSLDLPLRSVDVQLKFQYSYLGVLVKLQLYERAGKCAREVLSLIEQPGLNKFTIANSYIALARYYLLIKDYNKALACVVANGQIITKANLPTFKDRNLLLWYKVDSARKDYKAAFTHLLEYKTLEDSLFTEKKSKQIQQLQVKYETQKKEDDIKLLQQNALIDQVQLKNAQLTRNVTLAAIVLFMLVIAMQYRRYREKQKAHLIITSKNIALQKLVSEKEWLLKEVHHRVKNNLHTVICLLESQAAFLEDDALKAIENSRHRIYAMSLIHQKLYQSDDIKVVDMQQYLAEFIEYLKESFGSPEQIKITLRADDIKLAAAQAIPIGLIVNETMNNAFKYAFPQHRRGEIIVELKRVNDEIYLSISDDGVGFKPQADQELNSLGLELIKGLTLDLRGTITFNTNNGTSVQIRFMINSAHDLQDQSELTIPG